MSNRPEPMSAAEQAALGDVVIAMRGAGLCWKRICQELGMSRPHLARCLRLAGNGDAAAPPGLAMAPVREAAE